MTKAAKLHVRVSPGASREELVGPFGRGWKVRVTAPPEGGRANDAVIRLLAEQLQVPRRDLSIVTGASSRDKIVSLTGLEPDEVERRLASAVAGKESGK